MRSEKSNNGIRRILRVAGEISFKSPVFGFNAVQRRPKRIAKQKQRFFTCVRESNLFSYHSTATDSTKNADSHCYFALDVRPPEARSYLAFDGKSRARPNPTTLLLKRTEFYSETNCRQLDVDSTTRTSKRVAIIRYREKVGFA